MSNNVKVLLVDDNPMVLGMLKQSLSSMADVKTASDAPDALLKAVDDPPDVLVSDYRMPGMDGHQLIEKLKSRPSTASVADQDVGRVIHGLEQGVRRVAGSFDVGH